MPRKLLIVILVLSLLIELGLTGGIFFAKDLISKQFGVAMNGDTAFLSFIVGWLCLFASMIICLALYQLIRRNPNYAPLCYVMGTFWIAIGIAIYIGFHKPDNLLIDSLKGLLIILLTAWNERVTPLGKYRK